MTTGDLILSADFGTSGVKIGVVADDLMLIASTTEPYPLHLPGPSMAEQAPEDWWTALCRGTARLAADIPDLSVRIGSLVFCAQMCGLVCSDAQGVPVRPALVWLDKRSAPLIGRLLGGFPNIGGYGLQHLARWLPIANGIPSQNGMDPPGKMLWIKRHEPETYDRTAHLLDVKDWLIQHATGEVTTTADSANLTWLMDTRRGCEGWSAPLANRLGIPLDKLPRIVDGSSVVGGLTAAAAGQLGLRKDTPVVAGGGDVSATAIGSGAITDGALHICVSTSSWIAGFFNRHILSRRHYATITSSIAYRPLLIATQESAGSALSWLAETIDPHRHADGNALDEFYHDMGVGSVNDPYFLPWLAGERVPVDDERLRGTFHGLSLRHDQRALKRSVVEGVALNTRWAFSSVVQQKGAVRSGTIPMVGGGAASPHLAQAMADALNRQIQVGDTIFSGVLGAAAMAAPAMGWADTVWDAAAVIDGRDGPVYDPDPARVEMMNDRYGRLAVVRKSLVKLYRRPGGAR